MEHPPKQGLKLLFCRFQQEVSRCFNGTSTKTRIETNSVFLDDFENNSVLMEHPPKQGLKQWKTILFQMENNSCFNGTSTKTRIET